MPYKNKEDRSAWEKRWREANPDKVRAKTLRYREAHRQELCTRTKRWIKANREQVATYKRGCVSALKQEIISQYSNGELWCAQCGFNDIRALSLDHINGEGAKHRRSLSCGRGSKFYQFLRREGFPMKQELQVLCMNCQWVKRYTNSEQRISSVATQFNAGD